MPKWLLRGGRIVDPANGRDGVFDVLVDGARLVRVGRDLAVDDDVKVVDIPSGLVVCPGLIDMHVHLREPGQEHKPSPPAPPRRWPAASPPSPACRTPIR